MSSEATTLQLRDAPVAQAPHRRFARRVRELAPADARAWVGVLSLAAIVGFSLFLVLVAADRPSVISPTTHNNFFPRWMAGPLGGLWPGLTRSTTSLRYYFTGGVVLMYVAYLLALARAPQLRARWVWTAIVLVHLIYFLAPPMALTDVFNYINYGRMEVVHNLNPYTTIPILEPHADPAFSLSNWHQLLSPYGPLFTLLTFAVAPLGVAASFWALKAVIALASLGTLALVWRAAKLLGRDPVAAVILVGLNPIVLAWGLGGEHNDFLMVLFIVLAFYLLLLARRNLARTAVEQAVRGARLEGTGGAGAVPPVAPAGADRPHAVTAAPTGAEAANGVRSGFDEASAARSRRLRAIRARARWTSVRTGDGGQLARIRAQGLSPAALQALAGAAFVTAIAIKASSAVLVPVVIASLLRSPRELARVLAGMLAAGAVLAAASLLAFGLHIPDLNTQSSLVTNESVPNLIGMAVGAGGENETVRAVLTAGLGLWLIGCCWLALRRREAITASGWASVALLVTLSWVLPWYVLWALPLAALSRSRALRRATVIVGMYLIVAWSPASFRLWNLINFHPEKTALGRQHQRAVRELLN